MLYIVVLEKTLENLCTTGDQTIHCKGNNFWIFIGGIDAKSEVPILWPPCVKGWLIWKVPYTRKDWRQKEKRVAEDEMVGWHHQLNEHEFERTPGNSEGKRTLLAVVHGITMDQTSLSDWTTAANHLLKYSIWRNILTFNFYTINYFVIFFSVEQTIVEILFKCKNWEMYEKNVSCWRTCSWISAITEVKISRNNHIPSYLEECDLNYDIIQKQTISFFSFLSDF